MNLEPIPDNDQLLVRVPRYHVDIDGSIIRKTMAKKEVNGRMRKSCDWEKYSTPDQTRRRASRGPNGRDPDDFGVASAQAGEVRGLVLAEGRQAQQSVIHAPAFGNRAHSVIDGPDDLEIQMKLTRLLKWRIRINPSGR